MATMTEANPASQGPGGGASGSPDRVSHTWTRAPAGAPPISDAVVVVNHPDRRCPSGARQRAAASPLVTRRLLPGPAWVSTATAGRSPAAPPRWDW